jgi:hypothetical protein
MGPENLRDQVLVVRELQGLFLSVNKFISRMEAAENQGIYTNEIFF